VSTSWRPTGATGRHRHLRQFARRGNGRRRSVVTSPSTPPTRSGRGGAGGNRRSWRRRRQPGEPARRGGLRPARREHERPAVHQPHSTHRWHPLGGACRIELPPSNGAISYRQ
jgi:hypothetical protein